MVDPALEYRNYPFVKRKSVVHKSGLKKMKYSIYAILTIANASWVKQPTALIGGFVKGDDTIEEEIIQSSPVLPLTNSERRLTLLNQDVKENVLNLFEKSAPIEGVNQQKIEKV